MAGWTYTFTSSPSWNLHKVRMKQEKKCINLPIRRNKTGKELPVNERWQQILWSLLEQSRESYSSSVYRGNPGRYEWWQRPGLGMRWKQGRFKVNKVTPLPVFSPSCKSKTTAPPCREQEVFLWNMWPGQTPDVGTPDPTEGKYEVWG